jgi:hypothetical protein
MFFLDQSGEGDRRNTHKISRMRRSFTSRSPFSLYIHGSVKKGEILISLLFYLQAPQVVLYHYRHARHSMVSPIAQLKGRK